MINLFWVSKGKRPTITRTNLWGKVPRVVLRARTRNPGPEIRCCQVWLKSSFNSNEEVGWRRNGPVIQ